MSYMTPMVCKYHLRGDCKFGDRCRYSHGVRNPISNQSEQGWAGHCYYIPLPKKIPGAVAAGKKRLNFLRIEEGMLPHKVQLLPSDRGLNEIKVKVEAPNEELLRDVKESLKHLFASLFTPEQVWNLLHPDGVGGSSLRFCKYDGVLLKHFSSNPHCQEGTYVLCCDDKSRADDDKESASLEHPSEEGQCFSVLFNEKWVMDKLKDCLKQLKITQKQNPNMRGKLEVRLGKKIWFSLPKEVLENDKLMNLMELGDLLSFGSQFRGSMNTSVDASKVDKISRELKELSEQRHSVEIFNFNLTVPDEGGDQRKCVDARVIAMESGELKIIRVKKNESRVVAFDVMCLHRQHDFRLELDCHEIVRTYDPEFIVVKKLVETMSLTPGSLTFTPCNGWKVNMLRYKRQSTFLLEDTFMVTISDVKECCVNWENYSRRNEGDQLTVNLEDFENRHWELELSSVLWECALAKDVGQTPEEALKLYMEHPSVDPTVKARVPHPWDPDTFISQQDLHSILQKVDWLSEQLG